MPEYRSFIDDGVQIKEFEGRVNGRLGSFPEQMSNGKWCADCVLNDVKSILKIKDLPNSLNIEMMLEGTMNLANMVIEQFNNGNPVDFLIFLDKSARNGAFMLRTLWLELNKRGEIPEGVKLPEIKFINIGKNDDRKHESEAALTLLKLKYQDSFRGKKVALVDEFVETGNSLKLGLKTIKSVFEPREIMGVQHFFSPPHWYYHDHFKMVEDIDQQYCVNTTFSKLDEANSEQIISIYRLMSDLPRDNFNGHFNGNVDLSVRDILNILKIDPVNYDIVWDYIHIAGGFMTVPFWNENNKSTSKDYRRLLKGIVVKAMEYRDKNGKSFEL